MDTNTKQRNSQLGQSIIEVIISISIFVIIASSAITAILSSFSSVRLSKEESQATLLASEGIEAAKSIRNKNWADLINGDHGVSSASGTWVFSKTTDIYNKYTRKVSVSDVYRTNGNISQSGTVDPNTKKIISTITWNFSPSRNNTLNIVSYLTNWQTGNIKGPSPEATLLGVNTSGAVLSPNFLQLQGIALGNTSTSVSVTINRIRVTWTGNTTSRLKQILINGVSAWSGTENPGTNFNITDTAISPNTVNIPIVFIFNKSMKGSVFDLEFTMIDTTVKTISGVTP